MKPFSTSLFNAAAGAGNSGFTMCTFVLRLAGIYLHIPFCKQACSYCDFHFSTVLKNREALVMAMNSEITLRKAEMKDLVTSIYFGGGTPSILPLQDISRLIESIKHHFITDNNAEVTLEANPDDINERSVKEWMNAGVNRLSIGIQSFNNEELKWMNRAHDSGQSDRAVKTAQDSGIPNISIDLIYGSKFQTLQSWEKTLIKACDLQTVHISAYNLTIENKTVLGLKHAKGQEPAVNDEFSSDQLLIMRQILQKNSFVHYEISNFGKEGFFSRHNSSYWQEQPYLGIGPSAHSYYGSVRRWNISNNNQYIKALSEGRDFFEQEQLTGKDRYNEYILTRLRTIWGCDAEHVGSKFGNETLKSFNEAVRKNQEFLVRSGNIYTLNENGMLRADGIAASFFLL